MRTIRDIGLRVCCPACDSVRVRKVRRVKRCVTIECKDCKEKWNEIHDDGVVHGLVILAPGRRR